MVVDPACVAEINALLGSQKPVNQIVDQLVAALQKYGLAHYQPGVTPSQVLCHPHNRARQVISWLDMWARNEKAVAWGKHGHGVEHWPSQEGGADQCQQGHHPGGSRLHGTLVWPRTFLGRPQNNFVFSNQETKLSLWICICCSFLVPLRLPQHLCFPHHCIFESHPTWLHTRKWTSHWSSKGWSSMGPDPEWLAMADF